MLFALQTVVVHSAAIPNSEIQMGRPQMNISTLLGGQNPISNIQLGRSQMNISNVLFMDNTKFGFTAYPAKSVEFNSRELENNEFFDITANSNSLPNCSNNPNSHYKSSFELPEEMASYSTLKCYSNTADDENCFPHSTHENMTKCSTLKCHFNTAFSRNHFSHESHEKEVIQP